MMEKVAVSRRSKSNPFYPPPQAKIQAGHGGAIETPTEVSAYNMYVDVVLSYSPICLCRVSTRVSFLFVETKILDF